MNGSSREERPTPGAQDRLVFLFCHLLGHPVETKLKDGTVYEGLCHSISPDDFSLVISQARLKQSKVHPNGGKTKTKPRELLHIPATELVAVFAPEVSFGGERTFQEGGFFTDGDITGRQFQGGVERELQPCHFLIEGSTHISLDTEIASYKNNTAWDQFGENERRFGYRTTFDENLYTTPLDTRKLTAKEIREAERLAREIEQGPGDERIRGNVQYMIERNLKMERDYDEEELHSSVVRPDPPPRRPAPSLSDLSSGAPGKYVPPHKRSATTPKATDPTEFMAQALEPMQPLPAHAVSSADVERQLLEPSSAPARSPHLPLYQETGPVNWADELEREEEEEFFGGEEAVAARPLPPPPLPLPPREEPAKPLAPPAAAVTPAVPAKPTKPAGTPAEGAKAAKPPKPEYGQVEFSKAKKEDPAKRTLSREQEISMLKAWSVHLQDKIKKTPLAPALMTTSPDNETDEADAPSSPGSQSSKSSALNPNAKEWKPSFAAPQPAGPKKAAAPAASPTVPPAAAAPAAPLRTPAPAVAEAEEDPVSGSERPAPRVPRDEPLLRRLAGALVARFASSEGFGTAIGGDRQYSHLWVKAPPDLKDFVYYIDLESVQDETEALHHPQYTGEQVYGGVPDARQYAAPAYGGQPGYLPTPGPSHGPSSPLSAPANPYAAGGYGYPQGYGPPVGAYGGAGVAQPAATNAGGPPHRMPRGMAAHQHHQAMADMGQGGPPGYGRGPPTGGYYPGVPGAPNGSPASLQQHWQQGQGYGYRDQHSSGGPGAAHPHAHHHAHSHSPHAQPHAGLGHMQGYPAGPRGAMAGRRPDLTLQGPPRDVEEQHGKGRTSSIGGGADAAWIAQRPARPYAPPSPHRPPEAAPVAEEASKRGPPSKSFKVRGRKGDM